MKNKVITFIVVFVLTVSGCSQVQIDDIHNDANVNPSFSTNQLLELINKKKIFFLFSYKDNIVRIDDIRGNVSKSMLKKLIENNDEKNLYFKDCIVVMKNNKFSTCSNHIDSNSIFAMQYIDPINTVESAVAVVASVPIAILSTLVGQDNNLNNTYKRAKEHAVVKIADQKLIDKIGITISYLFYDNLDKAMNDIEKLESFIQTYNFLRKNSTLNNVLVDLYRKDGTFNSYLKAYKITHLEKDYILAKNVAISHKQKKLLQKLSQKIRIAETKRRENEAAALMIAAGIVYGGFKLIKGFFKLTTSGVALANGGNHISPSYDPCYSGDTCHKVIKVIKNNKVKIQCTKGRNTGRTTEMCANSNGYWATGCGWTDVAAHHYNNLTDAARVWCD